ncbi:MAG: hypothetical protein IJR73_08640, partial [Bacteroidales bacterium]|nr:hypothetical protein [Bacteroidales bacterium]
TVMSDEAYIQFVTEHAGDDPERLLLSADRWPQVDVRRAARNIAARAKIRTKIPSWYAHPELEYPGSLPLEQASSEATALYKQAFVPAGARIADLTGGLGVDCWFMSQHAAEAHYCERHGELCAAARHNFKALSSSDVAADDGATQNGAISRKGSHIAVHEGDGIKWLQQQTGHFDLIYLDPARRDTNARRVYDISDCEPNLLEVKDLLLSKGRRVLAKISPMADISRTLNQFPEARELHVLAVAGEVKELLLLLEAPGEDNSDADSKNAGQVSSSSEPLIVAHDILHDTAHHFEFRPSEEPKATAHYATGIGRYLLQPSKAVLKAGAFRLLSKRYNLEKLAPSTHLYTADTPPEGFPGKVFKVESVMEWSKSSIRQLKQQYDRLEMTALNFPLATDALRTKLGIKDGGTHHLFATTLSDKRKFLIIAGSILAY